MKQILLTLAFFAATSSFAQITNIYTKDGKKHSFPDSDVQMDGRKEEVNYKIEGDKKEKQFEFAEIDSITHNGSVFRTFRLNGSDKVKGYYVLSESADKKLLALVTRSMVGPNSHSERIKYFNWAIIDNSNKVLDEGYFTAYTRRNDRTEKVRVAKAIREHFSECEYLLEIFSYFDLDEKHKTTMNSFFENYWYTTCHKTPEPEDKKSEE